MPYYIEPNSNRHLLLKMAFQHKETNTNNGWVKQCDFCNKHLLSADTIGWKLAYTMGQVDLVEADRRECRILEKGEQALKILEQNMVYNAETNSSDAARTATWKMKLKAISNSIIPGKPSSYLPNSHVHDFLNLISVKGFDDAVDEYKKRSNHIKRHVGRINENKLIDTNKLSKHGELVLTMLNVGIDVKTEKVTADIIKQIENKIRDNLSKYGFQDAYRHNACNTYNRHKPYNANPFLLVLEAYDEIVIEQGKLVRFPFEGFRQLYSIFLLVDSIKDMELKREILKIRSKIKRMIPEFIKNPGMYCDVGYYSSAGFASHRAVSNYDILERVYVCCKGDVKELEDIYDQHCTLYQIQYS